MMTKLERIYWDNEAQAAAKKYNLEELWERYRNAKLMDDKEEVYMFRKAIKLRTADCGTEAAQAMANQI